MFFLALQNFFIFSVKNDICGANLHAKFQDRSPYKIARYCELFFLIAFSNEVRSNFYASRNGAKVSRKNTHKRSRVHRLGIV